MHFRPRYAERWAVMVFVIVPFAIVATATVATRLFPSSDPRERGFAHVFSDIFGFYLGIGIVEGTVVSLAHTYLADRKKAPPALAGSSARGAALGAAVLLPQGLLFGPGFLGPSIAVGVLAGAAYGVAVALLFGSRDRP